VRQSAQHALQVVGVGIIAEKLARKTEHGEPRGRGREHARRHRDNRFAKHLDDEFEPFR
jgi:hypothetical protein